MPPEPIVIRMAGATALAEKYPRLLAELEACFAEGERLTGVVRERLMKGGVNQ